MAAEYSITPKASRLNIPLEDTVTSRLLQPSAPLRAKNSRRETILIKWTASGDGVGIRLLFLTLAS